MASTAPAERNAHLTAPSNEEDRSRVSRESSMVDEPLDKEPNLEKTASGKILTRMATVASHASAAAIPPVEEDDLPHGLRLLAIVVALALTMFLVALDMTIVATAIPKITEEFSSLNDIGWYGSAFFLTIAGFQAAWGKAYRYFPLKTTFLVSVFIFELGSLICGVAPNSVALIVGRAIAGVGGAGIASGVYTIIAFSAAPSRRAVFTGILGAVYGVASVIGPLLGGVFTDKATWRWAFYINLPVGGVSAAIILLTFRAPPAAKPAEASWQEKILQMDLPGTFTIIAAVVCFLLAIQWGGVTKSWNDSQIIGLLVGFGLLVILFIVVQYFSGDRAVLQGRLLKNRNVLVSSVFAGFFGGAFFLLLYYLPLYFQSVDGVSAADSGIRNLPLVLGAALFSIISGGLISATGQFAPFLILGGVITSIGSGLLYTLDIGSGSDKWIGYQTLAGIGLGLAIQVRCSRPFFLGLYL